MKTSITLVITLAVLAFVAETNARPGNKYSQLTDDHVYNVGAVPDMTEIYRTHIQSGRRTKRHILPRAPIWGIYNNAETPSDNVDDDDGVRPISFEPSKKQIPEGVPTPPVEHGSIQGESTGDNGRNFNAHLTRPHGPGSAQTQTPSIPYHASRAYTKSPPRARLSLITRPKTDQKAPIWGIYRNNAETPSNNEDDDDGARPISFEPSKKQIPEGVRTPPVEHGSIQAERTEDNARKFEAHLTRPHVPGVAQKQTPSTPSPQPLYHAARAYSTRPPRASLSSITRREIGQRTPIWGIYRNNAETSSDNEDDDDGARPISFEPSKKQIPEGVRTPPVEHGSIQAEKSPKKKSPSKCQAAILSCCRFSEPERKNCFENLKCSKTYATGTACLPAAIDMVVKNFIDAYKPR